MPGSVMWIFMRLRALTRGLNVALSAGLNVGLRVGLSVACVCHFVDAFADEVVKVRLGTLAPKGSTYHRALQEMGDKWRQAQGGGASFIIYTDGTQGGEADMVRRMRVGQLNAALISVTGLMEIDRSVSALQYMPMVFREWGEVDYVRERLRDQLERRLFDRGFIVLFWGDAGWVRYFTRDRVVNPADFKRMRIFAWSGDSNTVDIMKTMGYQPVPLETADILSGLQTGLINVVPSGAYYALSGQFNTVVRHMVDVKWVPIVGAAVMTRRTWDQITPYARDQLRVAAFEAGLKIRERARVEDAEAVEAMRKRGLSVVAATPEIEAEWRRLAEAAYPKIRGSMVPAELFDQVRQLVHEYRTRAKAASRF
jgi:TRAP-type transport system periplasmic protein